MSWTKHIEEINMGSTISTITFYVAPSKERHPLVSQLFRFVDEYRDGKPRKVEKVTRTDGFLAGEFEICDGNMYEEEFDPEWVSGYPTDHPEVESERKMYEDEKKFFDLYRELGSLGYISEDHRSSWWSSSADGDGSDWYDVVGHTRYKIGASTKARDVWDEDYHAGEQKRKLKHFWHEYPNLMSIMKYDRADGQPQSLL